MFSKEFFVTKCLMFVFKIEKMKKNNISLSEWLTDWQADSTIGQIVEREIEKAYSDPNRPVGWKLRIIDQYEFFYVCFLSFISSVPD